MLGSTVNSPVSGRSLSELRHYPNRANRAKNVFLWSNFKFKPRALSYPGGPYPHNHPRSPSLRLGKEPSNPFFLLFFRRHRRIMAVFTEVLSFFFVPEVLQLLLLLCVVTVLVCMAPPPPLKRKRVVLSLEKKREILGNVDAGWTTSRIRTE